MRLRLWLPVHFQNTKPFLTTAGVNSKFSAALTSSLQNFYGPRILKGKAECIWRITCLEENVSVVFTTGFDKRHDSESDKIVSPHWVVVVSPLEYTWRQQVEHLKKTHWRTESVLSLTWFFLKESTWRLTRKNRFYFFLSPESTAGRKFSPTLLMTSDRIKDLDVCQFSDSR